MNEFLKDLEAVDQEEGFEDYLWDWREEIDKKIYSLMAFAKLRNKPLDKVKKRIREIIDDKLDEYHYVEKYHLLPEEEE